MKVMKGALGRLWRLTRATSIVVGLAVMVGLVAGVGTLAVAAPPSSPSGSLAVLKGIENTVTNVTSMVGSLSGPILRLDNNSTTTGATALDLQVESGNAPMTVNSTAGKATNLNADKVDGQDATALLSSETYTVVKEGSVPFSTTVVLAIDCDPGDLATSGGYLDLDTSSLVVSSARDSSVQSRWVIEIANMGNATDNFTGQVVCTDLPPLR